jgi:hypothetical protein
VGGCAVTLRVWLVASGCLRGVFTLFGGVPVSVRVVAQGRSHPRLPRGRRGWGPRRAGEAEVRRGVRGAEGDQRPPRRDLQSLQRHSTIFLRIG